MPVTFQVATHDATPIADSPPVKVEAFVKQCVPKETVWMSEVLQHSLGGETVTGVQATNNGFIDTVMAAYNRHHHLRIRPDDVWMCMLSQFSFYVNGHAEELRSKFVAHEGKKHLVVRASGTRYSVDFGDMSLQMTQLIDANVVDKSLNDWILAKFSTTTHTDIIIYAIQMLATVQQYFSYGFQVCCGIPSVTLLGEREDWLALFNRLDKLKEYGEEPTKWAEMLAPILSRFVSAFDGQPDVEFWTRVASKHHNGSGPSFLSGWITAFCFWDSTGKPLRYRVPQDNLSDMPLQGIHVVMDNWSGMQLSIDGQRYPSMDESKVPPGYSHVPVILNDNGEVFDTIMVAGHLASRAVHDPTSGVKNTVQPNPGWFMFIKDTSTEDAEREEFKELSKEGMGLPYGSEKYYRWLTLMGKFLS